MNHIPHHSRSGLCVFAINVQKLQFISEEVEFHSDYVTKCLNDEGNCCEILHTLYLQVHK